MIARRHVFGVIAAAVMATAVRGDEPTPPGTRLLPVYGEIQGMEAFPDYRFFWANSMTYTGFPRPGVKSDDHEFRWRSDIVVEELMPTPDGTVLVVGGNNLFAIPRSEVGPRTNEELIEAVLRGQVPGVVQNFVEPASLVSEDDPRNEIVVVFRIEPSPAGIGLVIMRIDGQVPVPENRESNAHFWKRVAIVATLVLGGIALLWVEQRRRLPPSPANPTA